MLRLAALLLLAQASPSQASGVQGAIDGPDGSADDDADAERARHQTVVTASRTEVRLEDSVVATEVLPRSAIERSGARELGQLVQAHPGVELVHTNRGTGLRLQGLDPEYVLVLVDGQRVAGRAGSMVDLSRFSLRDVERVEITKGPAAALYGADAIGGVVNLVLRRPTKPFEASLRASGGTLSEGDLRAHVAAKRGPVEVRGGAGFRTRSAYDWEPGDVASSGPSLRRLDVDGEVAVSPSAAVRLFTRAGYAWSDLAAVDLNDTGAVFDRLQRVEQLDVAAGARATLGERTSGTLRAHYGLLRDQFLVDQRGSRALDEYSVNLTHLGELLLQGEHRAGAHELAAGAEGLVETLGSTRIAGEQAARQRLGLFAQDRWSAGGPGRREIALEPGLRFDADSQFGSALSPRVALKVEPVPALTLRAAWGTGFRPPSFTELGMRFSNAGIGYVVVGNPALLPERSHSVTLGADVREPAGRFGASLGVWHTDLTNLISITAGGPASADEPTRFSYENVASAWTRGLELSGRARLVPGLSLELSYMGLDSRDVARGRPLEGRAPHRVTAQLTGRHRPWALEGVVRGGWSSPRPYYPDSGLGLANVLGRGEVGAVIAPALVDLEVQVTWRAFAWLRLFASGSNLLDSGDQRYAPRPPRAGLVGLQLDV